MTLSIARARRLLYSIPVILFLYYYFNKEKNTREEIQIDNFGASSEAAILVSAAVLDDFNRAQLGSSWVSDPGYELPCDPMNSRKW